MKKIICIIFLCILPVTALALSLPDLSEYSYDDLVLLRDIINEEIMTRPEWKEVTVPAGNWEVPADIPAGVYSIRATEAFSSVRLENKEGHFVFYKTMDKDEVCGKAEFAPGCVLYLSNPVILAPAVSLGF